MIWKPFQDWLSGAPLLLIALLLFGGMFLAAVLGSLRVWRDRRRQQDDKEPEGQEGYIVSAVLGLLALLMGFTFSLAVDRFDARRLLVLEEANAIGTTYLRAQLLPEPHRARMSDILVRYTENRVTRAKTPAAKADPLIRTNDQLIIDMWAATNAAFPSIQGLDFSSAYLASVNHVIDLDTSRKTARAARVPAEVFIVLFVYLLTTAAVLGYVLHGVRGRISAGFLLALLTLSLLLILDIDRPLGGGVGEGQGPMEALRNTLRSQPASVYDRWRPAQPAAAPPGPAAAAK